MQRRATLLGLASLGLLYGRAAEANTGEIIVIAHPSVSVSSLDAATLRLIFQVSQLRWPNSELVIPFNLPEDSPLRQAFDQAVLGLAPDKVARYWIDKRIRGDVRPPRKANSEALVLRAVGRLPGAIGYVGADEDKSQVKVLARIKNGKVV